MSARQESLGDRVAESYAQHPSFRFDQQPLEVDAHRLRAFDEAFELARTLRRRLTPIQLQALRLECARALDGLFSSFEAQAADPLERSFLLELRAECQRLLAEELDLYGASKALALEVDDLRARGHTLRMLRDRHFFGCLPAAAVREILDIAAPSLAVFRESARSGRLKREDLSRGDGAPNQAIVRVLNREFAASGVLRAMSAYAERRMVVTGVGLELSVATATWWANGFEGLARPPRTLYAHLDESIKFPKCITYLTDVGPTGGPTSCYPHAYEDLRLDPLQELVGRVVGIVGNAPDSPLKGHYGKRYHQSMTSEGFRRHFMRLPPSLRFNSHLGWDLLPDGAAERTLVARERTMLGPAGTFVVFDGAKLLHRGGMVQEGERVALQVIFGEPDPPPPLLRRIKGRLVRELRRPFA